VRPVHHEVDGIAAQAVAMSHALATGSMRADTDMLSASAQEVASSVRRLQVERPRAQSRSWTPSPVSQCVLLICVSTAPSRWKRGPRADRRGGPCLATRGGAW
jgi:hypothetical protein